MKKIAYLIDSGSCNGDFNFNNQQDIYLLPLWINEVDNNNLNSYKDLVDLKYKDVYDKIENNYNLSTSQASYGEIYSIYEDLLSKYDYIVVINMSCHLSSVFKTCTEVAEEFPNDRIFIFNTKNVGPCNYFLLNEMMPILKTKDDILKLKKFIENEHYKKIVSFICVNDIDSLVKGGRLSPLKAIVVNKIALKLIVRFFDGKLEFVEAKKSLKNIIESMFKNANKILDFKNNKIKNIYLITNNSQHKELDEYKINIKEIALKKWNINIDDEKLTIEFIPSVISVHTGKNTIGITFEIE